ncbi:MAG: AraC family transcriptional regulator [Lachnospiraceae bacterium]|nr:AraC family transcriptional regulator [Lachnospiraceae bacterium]
MRIEDHFYNGQPGEDSRGVIIYHIGDEPCRPGHSYGPAVRDHYLIHCVLKGRGKFCKQGKEWKVGSGQGFLILPDELTYYEADREEPWEYCWVGFHGRDIAGIIRQCQLSEEAPIFSFADSERMLRCVRRMRELLKERDGEFQALSRLYEVFSMIRGEEEYQDKSEHLAGRVRAYIEKNYSYGITVAEIARAFAVDRSHMFRCFKKEYGVSVQDYLLQYRLKRARQLIEQTDMNVTEIMYSCGFMDLPNFSRQFKKKYGEAPAHFRGKEGIL